MKILVKSSMDMLVSRQPVEARDEVKNMGQLGQLDSCHGEKVPKPGGGSNLPNGISAKAILCYVFQIPMD